MKWQLDKIKEKLYSHQTLRLLRLLISSAPWICSKAPLLLLFLCTTTLVVQCLKLLCFNFRKHCFHVSNLSDGKISVLTPEDYSQCSISSSLSIAIYLHAMIVPVFHKNLHKKRFGDLQKAQGGGCVAFKSTALPAFQNQLNLTINTLSVYILVLHRSLWG